MKFWDSSALVPLVIEESNSRECRDLYRADRRIVAWEYTEIEVASGLVKQTRLHPPLPRNELGAALLRLDSLAKKWEIVEAATPEAVKVVKLRAREHMVKHALRAGDALQLAAATIRLDPPMGRDFVVSDGSLADAAEREGFNVIRLVLQPRRRGS